MEALPKHSAALIITSYIRSVPTRRADKKRDAMISFMFKYEKMGEHAERVTRFMRYAAGVKQGRIEKGNMTARLFAMDRCVTSATTSPLTLQPACCRREVAHEALREALTQESVTSVTALASCVGQSLVCPPHLPATAHTHSHAAHTGRCGLAARRPRRSARCGGGAPPSARDPCAPRCTTTLAISRSRLVKTDARAQMPTAAQRPAACYSTQIKHRWQTE
jgi:hypothetical protein